MPAPDPRSIHIDDLTDPRIAGYRNIRERDLRAEGLFIAEGALLAQRLLHSRFQIESLFVTAGAEDRLLAELENELPPHIPLYVAGAALMRQIVGFDFHRGVLALGRRSPMLAVETLIEAAIASRTEGTLRFVACPGTETAENLGMILRSAAAFGLDGVLLPQAGADPFSRRCLRQSMGSALTVPLAQSLDLRSELAALSHSHGLKLVAAVAAANAGEQGRETANQDRQRPVIELAHFSWPQRAILLVGNEYVGVDHDWLDLCDHLVTIPHSSECDSLNVAVASGILMYHMTAQHPSAL